MCHDDVVRLIGSSRGTLTLQITEHGISSDSSESSDLPLRPHNKYQSAGATARVRSQRHRRDELAHVDFARSNTAYAHVRRAQTQRSVSPNHEVAQYFDDFDDQHFRRDVDDADERMLVGIENTHNEPYAQQHTRRHHRYTTSSNQAGGGKAARSSAARQTKHKMPHYV